MCLQSARHDFLWIKIIVCVTAFNTVLHLKINSTKNKNKFICQFIKLGNVFFHEYKLFHRFKLEIVLVLNKWKY